MLNDNPHAGRKRADAVIAAAIAGGATRKQAAERAKVSVRTVGHRLADPAFKAIVKQYRARMIDRTLGALSKGIAKAAAKLVKLIDADDDGTSHRACTAVLDRFASLQSVADMEERLAELERRIDANANQPRPHTGAA